LKSEEEKLTLKHYRTLVDLAQEKETKTVVEIMSEDFSRKLYEEAKEKVSGAGATLSKDLMAERVDVHMVFLELGIPISKLQSPRLVSLIEKPHKSLGGNNGIRAVQPLVQDIVLGQAKAAIAGRAVGITFDGSKVNFSIEGTLARVLNDDFMPVSLCVGVHTLTMSLDSVTLRTIIRRHLSEAGINMANVAFCSDSGPPNPTAMRE
jgi:hypothetical protein